MADQVTTRYAAEKVFAQEPVTLAASGATVIDCRGMSRLTLITGAGATATWSRVDTEDASAHTTQQETVTAGLVESIDIDWPYIRVSVAGGSCRLALS